jgi:hypothetical protein
VVRINPESIRDGENYHFRQAPKQLFVILKRNHEQSKSNIEKALANNYTNNWTFVNGNRFDK